MKQYFHPYQLIPILFLLITGCEIDIAPPADQGKAFVKYYGLTAEERGNDLTTAIDTGYVLLGSSTSFGSGDKDFYVIKVNENGNEEWSNHFGDMSSEEIGLKVKAATDGYVLLGNKTSDLSSKIMLAKVDLTGEPIWPEPIVLNTTTTSMEFASDFTFAQNPDDGLFVVGTTTTGTEQNSYITMLAADGSTLWDSTLVTSSPETALSVHLLNDTTFLTVGTRIVSADNIDLTLSRFYYTAAGASLDTTIYLDIGESFQAVDVFMSTNSQLLVLGKATASAELKILVVNSSSLEPIGSLVATGLTNHEAAAITQAADQDYLLLSTKVIAGETHTDITLTKISTTGTLNWERAFTLDDRTGRNATDQAAKVIRLNDGGIALTGTFDLTTNLFIGLVRTNENGLLK